MATHIKATQAAQNSVYPNAFSWQILAKNDKIIYSVGLSLAVFAVEYGSFWKEIMTGSMTGLKLEKFFKISLVLKLCCSTQLPSPPTPESRGLLEHSPFRLFGLNGLMGNFVATL